MTAAGRRRRLARHAAGAALACTGTLAATIAIAACGAGSRRHTASAAARKVASSSASSTTAPARGGDTSSRASESPPAPAASSPESPGPDLELSSAAILRASPTNELAREYTCDGADRSPPVSWHGIPPSARELTLFVINLKPVNGRLFFDWAVAGIDPKLKGLEAGRLPPGAVQGRNGYGDVGYSLCPPGAARESYVMVLYAPPKRFSPPPGFEPLALRNAVVQIAPRAGLLGASYQRVG